MNKGLENNSIISHYKIQSKIGKGGMGEVYLAENMKLDRELEKAYQERDYFMPRIKVEPFMDQLWDDPRFDDLVKRMNLPE